MNESGVFFDPAFPLDKVLVSEQLAQRPARAPDFEAESRAFNELARELSRPRCDVLKKLTDSALALCRAHTAGISILEMSEGHRVFRWHAVSGKWAHHEGGSMPREASPCGTIIDRNRHELMAAPQLHYLAMRGVEPPAHEALLIPFTLLGEPVGTLWIIAHDDSVRFDSEDLRVMGNLACFAAAAYVLHTSLQQSLQHNEELNRFNARLLRSHDAAADAIERAGGAALKQAP